MEKNEQIIKEIFKEIIGIAEKQKREFVKLINKKPVLKSGDFISFGGIYQPKEIALVRQVIEKDSFFEMQLNAFWILYRHVYEIIDKAISQLGLRSLLDICYSKIIYFSKLKEGKQKEIAIKSWLCITGFILTNKKEPQRRKLSKDYKTLIAELNKENDKKYFVRLEKEGFPLKKIVKANKRVWHGLGDDFLWGMITKDLESFWGKSPLTKEKRSELIRGLYSWFSLLLHGDFILLRNLDSDKENKGHLFRAYTILLLSGMQVLKTTDKFLKIQNNKIKDIEKRIKENLSVFINLKKS